MKAGVYFGSAAAADMSSIFVAQMGYWPRIIADTQDATDHAMDNSSYPWSSYVAVAPAGAHYSCALPIICTGNPSANGAAGGADGTVSAQYTAIMAGTYDSNINSLITYLTNHDSAPIFRIGWEFNGDWYAHGTSEGLTNAQYQAIFHHYAVLIHAKGGLTCWNPVCLADSDNPSFDVLTRFPTNPTDVDFIGVDVYAESNLTHSPGTVVLDRILNQGPGYQGGIAGVTVQGLNSYYVPMSQALGIPLMLPELGLIAQTAGTGDDPDFIDGMAAWAQQNNALTVLWGDQSASANLFNSGSPLSTARAIADFQVAPMNRILCIDTMKGSRDNAIGSLTSGQIEQQVNLDATLYPTHITVATANDPTWVATATLWINAIRATTTPATGGPCHVWFRMQPNQWEDYWGTTGYMSPAAATTAIVAFINNNPTLFENGDVFDFLPEGENGLWWTETYGSSWSSSQPAIQAYNQWTITTVAAVRAAFVANGFNIDGPTGIETRIHSVDSFFATTPKAFWDYSCDGYLAMDFYPDAGITSPSAAAAAVMAQLNSAKTARPQLIIGIGEHGYDSSTVCTDALQLSVDTAEYNAILAGYLAVPVVNRWCDVPDSGSPGYANILEGSVGAWTPRPAAAALSAFYQTLLGIGITAPNRFVMVGAQRYRLP